MMDDRLFSRDIWQDNYFLYRPTQFNNIKNVEQMCCLCIIGLTNACITHTAIRFIVNAVTNCFRCQSDVEHLLPRRQVSSRVRPTDPSRAWSHKPGVQRRRDSAVLGTVPQWIHPVDERPQHGRLQQRKYVTRQPEKQLYKQTTSHFSLRIS